VNEWYSQLVFNSSAGSHVSILKPQHLEITSKNYKGLFGLLEFCEMLLLKANNKTHRGGNYCHRTFDEGKYQVINPNKSVQGTKMWEFRHINPKTDMKFQFWKTVIEAIENGLIKSHDLFFFEGVFNRLTDRYEYNEELFTVVLDYFRLSNPELAKVFEELEVISLETPMEVLFNSLENTHFRSALCSRVIEKNWEYLSLAYEVDELKSLIHVLESWRAYNVNEDNYTSTFNEIDSHTAIELGDTNILVMYKRSDRIVHFITKNHNLLDVWLLFVRDFSIQEMIDYNFKFGVLSTLSTDGEIKAVLYDLMDNLGFVLTKNQRVQSVIMTSDPIKKKYDFSSLHYLAYDEEEL
jgi:hypothetical protein